MKEPTITNINFSTLKSLVQDVCDDNREYHQIPLTNSQKVKDFINHHKESDVEFVTVSYKKGDEIVTDGTISDKSLQTHSEFDYSHVPLGFILKGKITVIKGGKGLKELSEGDFLGLFETSDFLLNGKKRQIGDWTLVANTDAEVIYFGSSVLQDKTTDAETFKSYLVELSRADYVPQPITYLPLLDWVASHTTKSRPRDCIIIAHTHLLPNNRPLFRHLSSLLDFGNIYVLEKPYSTIPAVTNELIRSGFEVIPVHMETDLPYEFAVGKSLNVLWRKVVDDQKRRQFKKILIVDDGGDVWRSIPWDELKGIKIAAVEQTQRGVAGIEKSNQKFPPIVSVASSGVKKVVESEFIGLSVVKKLDEMGLLRKAKQVGIVGMGSIGIAVDQNLRSMGITALSYDSIYHMKPPDSPQARFSLDVLMNESDLIIGTTGTDALKGLPFERVTTGRKILVSASSADLEFSSLLKLADPHSDPFGTVTVSVHDRLTIEILNGGYPINFDRQKDSTPNDDIVLTRCLMYIGAMQALELIDEGIQKSVVYNLDKVSQTKTLERWIKDKNKTENKTHFTKNEIEEIVKFTPLKVGKDMPSVWKD